MKNKIKHIPMPRAYFGQITTMAERAKEWRKANPDKEAKVQFNFPETVIMISPISEALKSKIVSANEGWSCSRQCGRGTLEVL